LSIAYVSFDTVPAHKGAATHIEAFAKALGRSFHRIDLVTVANGNQPVREFERWPGVVHTEIPATGPSLIDRVLHFRAGLARWLDSRPLRVIQFRSIFEGFELIKRRPEASFIYEVNGLPSIELRHRYPGSEDDRELMSKIRAQEKICLERANMVIAPSAITLEHLGISRAKSRLIPNGVDPERFLFSPPQAMDGTLRLCYFGTLSTWQGVEVAVRAVAQMRPLRPAELVIIGSGSERQRHSIARLAAKLCISSCVTLLPAVPQDELLGHLHRSHIVLAPLTANDRNVVQGCCPLKILETMASGVPLITTDLPAIRELGEPDRHFVLVKPGSVDELAGAIIRLASDIDRARSLAFAARAHVEAKFTWDRAGNALINAYEELGINCSTTA